MAKDVAPIDLSNEYYKSTGIRDLYESYESHIALQAMAFTSAEYDYNTLRAIYEQQDLRVTPIESKPRSSMKADGCRAKCLRDTTAITAFASHPDTGLTSCGPLCRSRWKRFRDCLWDKVRRSADRSGCLSMSFWTSYTAIPTSSVCAPSTGPWYSERELMEIVFQMAHQPENAAFLKYVDPQILTLAYYTEYVDHWTNLEPVEHEELQREVFWENDQVDQARRQMMLDCYRYNVEFLQTGNIQQVFGLMAPKGGYHKMLSIINMVHEGNYMGAWQDMSQILKKGNSDTFDEPLTNFVYAIALGLTDAPQARKTAEKLMKSRKATADSTCYAASAAPLREGRRCGVLPEKSDIQLL